MQDTKERYFLKVRKDFGIEIEKQFGFEEESVSHADVQCKEALVNEK